MEPSKRIETLQNFAKRITTTEKVAAQVNALVKFLTAKQLTPLTSLA